MDSEMTISWISVGISSLSLIVAVIAIIKSQKAQNKSNSLQETVVKIEERREKDRIEESKKANLSAELKKRIDSSSYDLIIENHGESLARNLKVLIDEQPFKEHSAHVRGSDLPDKIGSHGSIKCLFIPEKTSYSCEIVWDDDLKDDRKYETSLTL